MSNAPDTPPGDPAPAPSRRPLVIAGLGAALLVGVVATVVIMRSDGKKDDPVVDTATVAVGEDGRPLIPAFDTKEPYAISEVDAPSVWIDSTSPQALRSVLTENAWLKTATSSPLGRGFLGGWGALLGSSNDDLGLAKLGQGLLGDVIAEQLLTQPMRLTWFAGWGGTPALVVPKPSAALTTTVSTLTQTMQRGGYLVDQCPGEPAVTDEQQKLGVVRWIVADQTVYVVVARDRLVVAKDVGAAVNALCMKLPEIKVEAGNDVVVHILPQKLGRDAQMLGAILGGSDDVALAFGIEGASLKPRGLAGTLAHPGRLGDTAISKETWKLVPEDMPVVVAANLKLPASLSTDALYGFWEQRPVEGALKNREVLLLWQPHGDQRGTEVAIVWSDVSDRAALQAILSGPNDLKVEEACGRLVASSTSSLLTRIQASCAGASPSLLFAQPGIVSGLSRPLSAGLIVDTGRLLQNLLLEGHAHDAQQNGARPTTVPVEIEAARKQLSELPRLGAIGLKKNAALVGEGFSS